MNNLGQNFLLHIKKNYYKIYGISLSRQFSIQATNFSKPSYYHHIGKEPLIYQNIGQTLEQAAQKYSDREALISCHENKRFTFKSVLKKVDQLAAGFWKIGLNRGDPIGIWAPNNANWYLTMMAAARVGLVLVGINPYYQGPELEYCIQKVGIKALITKEVFRNQHYYEMLQVICPKLRESEVGKLKCDRVPSLKTIIIDSDDKLPGTIQFNEMFSLADNEAVSNISNYQSKIEPDSPCNIQFTSGTTGKPKAAILSHFGFVNNGYHIGNRNELNIKHQKICVQVPLFHAYGVVISVMASICHGASLILPSEGYDAEKSLQAIINEKCTVIHGTPTMYVDLINKQKKLKLPLKTATIGITGGAPCSPQLFKDIKEVLGLKKVKTVFGMTENSAVSFQSLPGDSEDKVLHTVGHLTDHIEAKVVDTNGEMVPFGQPGELWIRGYFIMREYHEDDAKTKETVGLDRWLRTGDQFILNENGYGKIVGRLKDMIIRGGENIFPKEIEDFLNTHPDIIESHVIGVPDERLGEEICAFLRLRDGLDNLDQLDVKQYCKGKISHFKIPKYVKIIENFPKTTSGKIMKYKLYEMFTKTKLK